MISVKWRSFFHFAPHSDDLDYIQLVFIVRVISSILVAIVRGEGLKEGHERKRGSRKEGVDIKSRADECGGAEEKQAGQGETSRDRGGGRRRSGVLDRKVCLTVKR